MFFLKSNFNVHFIRTSTLKNNVNLIKIEKNTSKNETVPFYTHTKIKNGVPLRGLNAMPFRTEARKCNHWVTGGLSDLVRKFNDAYMHMQSSCIDSVTYLRKYGVKEMADLMEINVSLF